MRRVRESLSSRSVMGYIASLALLLMVFCTPVPGFPSDAAKWTGVDESVVERIAKEHGRVAREPLINTDRGDLLLFAFLLAGAVGGFAGGYYWRKLVERRTDIREGKE
jgi:hypothetical protein